MHSQLNLRHLPSITGHMLARLTNPIRVQTGRLLALVYLLCVLAPAAALAFGSPAPCLELGTDTALIMPAELAADAALHTHDAGSHDLGGMHASGSHVHHHGGKKSPGPCCAMLCLSAVPTALPAVTKPSFPRPILVTASFRPLRGEAPPLPYRPPIA